MKPEPQIFLYYMWGFVSGMIFQVLMIWWSERRRRE